jgi:hypothetical protein
MSKASNLEFYWLWQGRRLAATAAGSKCKRTYGPPCTEKVLTCTKVLLDQRNPGVIPRRPAPNITVGLSAVCLIDRRKIQLIGD